jgi:hypothetical protein
MPNDAASLFVPAVRRNTAFIGALCGGSGSGKTLSALLLAEGLAGPDGRIVVIDSEGDRALHYADDHEFFHYSWRAPYTPQSLGKLLRAAEAEHFAVVIVDSTSDEHEGEGGLCDMAEAEYAKQGEHSKNSASAWARPKAQHKQHVVRWLRQARCHVIFCCRASEKVKFEKVERNGRETTVIVPVGWTPIAEKNLLYDVTTSLLFTPDDPGVPQPIKLYERHRPFFPAGKRITQEAGRLLAQWCAGGAPQPPEAGELPLLERAQLAASSGTAALKAFWDRLTVRADRVRIRPLLGTKDNPGDLMALAIEADHDLAADQKNLFDMSFEAGSQEPETRTASATAQLVDGDIHSEEAGAP